MAQTEKVIILMYHSISDGHGPTCIPADAFRTQLQALRDAGFHTVRMTDIAAWHRGEINLAPRTAAITFDDGFKDFALNAHPGLTARDMPATVFVPSRCIGGVENWAGAHRPPRALLDWPDIRALASDGVEFGGHGLTHADLTALPRAEMVEQVRGVKDELEQKLGCRTTLFAPPYGRSTAAVRSEIARHYEASVGTAMSRATRRADLMDLPRIEMHYFRDRSRWQRFLDREFDWYFATRQTLRSARRLALR